MSQKGPDDSSREERRAFVVVRTGDTTHFVELEIGTDFDLAETMNLLHGSGPEPGSSLFVSWNGEAADAWGEGELFHNGKLLEHRSEIKPGDEIRLGDVQVVLGISEQLSAGGRRALTHNEFRERLAEEIARASRRGQRASLVMVRTRPGEGGRWALSALSTFRAGDIIAAYGPDEYELLLPDTDSSEAHAAIARVNATVDIETAAGVAVAPTEGDHADRLLLAARTALRKSLDPTARDTSDIPTLDPILLDPASRSVLEDLGRADGADGNIVLVGETSTGKATLAHLIHRTGIRSQGPFVTIDCHALTPDEEREAFGSDEDEDEDDAATVSNADALVEQARGGTLLLEEVGELTEDAQNLLLDAMDRLGSKLRIISTTERALAGLVDRGAFHAELFRRLAHHIIEVPSLRNRPDDIMPLAERFALEHGALRPVRMAVAAWARMRSYPWPGNVLELRNAIERAVRLSGDGEILAEHLPSEPLPVMATLGRLREQVDGVERDAIIRALADSNHNQTHAARRLGISRRALIYKMEKYGLKRPPAHRRGPL